VHEAVGRNIGMHGCLRQRRKKEERENEVLHEETPVWLMKGQHIQYTPYL
jgi:hypothetical protein